MNKTVADKLMYIPNDGAHNCCVLNNQMQPVMPSLEGKGTLSVKQVKMKGFKLLNTVASKTENPDIKDPDITKVKQLEEILGIKKMNPFGTTNLEIFKEKLY